MAEGAKENSSMEFYKIKKYHLNIDFLFEMKLLTECMTFEYDANLIKEQAQTEDGRFLMKGILQIRIKMIEIVLANRPG